MAMVLNVFGKVDNIEDLSGGRKGRIEGGDVRTMQLRIIIFPIHSRQEEVAKVN